MWAFGVDGFSPLLDEDLSFFPGVEDFPIEQFVSQLFNPLQSISLLINQHGKSRCLI